MNQRINAIEVVQAAPNGEEPWSFLVVYPPSIECIGERTEERASRREARSSTSYQAAREESVRLLYARAAALNQQAQHDHERCTADNADD
jgi:hypothetical protein